VKKINYEDSDNESLIHRLSTYQSNSRYTSVRTSNHQPEGASAACSRLMKQIVTFSFMPILRVKRREYYKMGQDLELPFVKILLKKSKQGLTEFPVEHIYHVGLVGKEGELYSKASGDLVTGALNDGEKILVGGWGRVYGSGYTWCSPERASTQRASLSLPGKPWK
jgi:hypothetical protein